MKRAILFLSLCAFFTCSNGDDSGENPELEVNEPTEATLMFPTNNCECLEGTNGTAIVLKIHFITK